MFWAFSGASFFACLILALGVSDRLLAEPAPISPAPDAPATREGEVLPKSLPSEVQSLLEKARAGDGASQLALSFYYEKEGQVEEALLWLKEAAQKGLPEALGRLAGVYEEGRWGVDRNPVQALQLYEEAASKGDRECLCHWVRLVSSRGLPVDPLRAQAWLWAARKVGCAPEASGEQSRQLQELFPPQQARIRKEYVELLGALAEKGDAKAKEALGEAYWEGISVPVDRSQSVRLWKEAAHQGEPQAQWRLGLAYAEGLGVSENLEEALRWLLLAQSHGPLPPQAQKTLARLQNRLAPGDLEQAKYWVEAALGRKKMVASLLKSEAEAAPPQRHALPQTGTTEQPGSPGTPVEPARKPSLQGTEIPGLASGPQATEGTPRSSPESKKSAPLASEPAPPSPWNQILAGKTAWAPFRKGVLWFEEIFEKEHGFPFWWTVLCTAFALLCGLLAWLLPGDASSHWIEQAPAPSKKKTLGWSHGEASAGDKKKEVRGRGAARTSRHTPGHVLGASPVQQDLWRSLARWGRELLDNPKVLAKELNGGPEDEPERRALLAVAEAGLLSQLRNHPHSSPLPERWIRLLQEEQGLARPWALWALETWLWALETALHKAPAEEPKEGKA
jgi:TPR repeat protein